MTLPDCIFVGLLRSWSKKTTNSSGVLSNCSSRTNAHLILSHFIQSQTTVWTARWLFNRLNEHILLVLGQYKVTVQEHTYWTPTYATDKSFCKCNQDPMEIPVDPGIKFLKLTSVICSLHRSDAWQDESSPAFLPCSKWPSFYTPPPLLYRSFCIPYLGQCLLSEVSLSRYLSRSLALCVTESCFGRKNGHA